MFERRRRPRAAKRDRAYLVVLAGASVGEMYKIEGDKTVIGRGQKAQIRLLDDGISREHAQLVIEASGSSSQDLGSTNGTYCNGLKVDRQGARRRRQDPGRLDDDPQVHLPRQPRRDLPEADVRVGAARRAHQGLQQEVLHRPARERVHLRDPPRSAAVAGALRHRPLQEGQRHPRPPGRRLRAVGDLDAAHRRAARRGRLRALRRRGVRASSAAARTSRRGRSSASACARRSRSTSSCSRARTSRSPSAWASPACPTRPSRTPPSSSACADQALYKSKHAGRNRVTLHKPSPDLGRDPPISSALLKPASAAVGRASLADGRGRGRGVQMSCQELDDDLALIRFVCPRRPPQAPRSAEQRARREKPDLLFCRWRERFVVCWGALLAARRSRRRSRSPSSSPRSPTSCRAVARAAGDDDDERRRPAGAPAAPPASRSRSTATGSSRSSRTAPPSRRPSRSARRTGAAPRRASRGDEGAPAGRDERLAARYLLALARANQSKWTDAGQLFEELYDSYPKLAPYHAYHAARCRLRRGDAAGALEWAGRCAQGTVPEAEAALVRIDALRALARWDEALAAMRPTSTASPAGRAAPRRCSSKARRWRSARGRPRRRGAQLADATAILPPRLGGGAARGVGRSRGRAARADRGRAAGARGGARAHAHRRRVGHARHGLLRQQPQRRVRAGLRRGAGGARARRAISSARRASTARSRSGRQRQRPRAAPLFDEAEAACAHAGNRDLHAKALYQGGALLRLGREPRRARTARYARIEAEHADHSYADDARIRDGRARDRRRRRRGRRQDPGRGADPLPEGRPAQRGALAAGLRRLARRQARRGAALARREPAPRPARGDLVRRGARALLEGARARAAGQADDARALYERAVREYPLSVYALLALARLETLGRRRRGGAGRVAAQGPPRRAGLVVRAAPALRRAGFLRAVELARMGQGGDARRELARLGLATSAEKHALGGVAAAARAEDEDLLWITAILLDRGGVWSASHSIPRYGLTRTGSTTRRGSARPSGSSPTRAPSRRWSRRTPSANQLPEALQLAIMREESAFSPRTESFANAIGLTQMLIKTAKRFANGAPVTRDVLLDPAKNVEIGSRFLGFLWKRFNGARAADHRRLQRGRGGGRSLARRARRPRHGRVHGDDPLRRDAQLHQARARLVLRLLLALRRQAGAPRCRCGRAPDERPAETHVERRTRRSRATRPRADAARATSSSCAGRSRASRGSRAGRRPGVGAQVRSSSGVSAFGTTSLRWATMSPLPRPSRRGMPCPRSVMVSPGCVPAAISTSASPVERRDRDACRRARAAGS